MNKRVAFWLVVALAAAGTRPAVAQKSAASSVAQPLLAAPAVGGRYAVVRGTVRIATTGRPVAHVLLGIESFSYGYFGVLVYGFTGDSARTNAHGYYEIRFRTQSGQFNQNYLVRMEPTMGRGRAWPSSYVFQTNKDILGPDERPDSREVLAGAGTTADFAPDFARPWNTQLQPKGH